MSVLQGPLEDKEKLLKNLEEMKQTTLENIKTAREEANDLKSYNVDHMTEYEREAFDIKKAGLEVKFSAFARNLEILERETTALNRLIQIQKTGKKPPNKLSMEIAGMDLERKGMHVKVFEEYLEVAKQEIKLVENMPDNIRTENMIHRVNYLTREINGMASRLQHEQAQAEHVVIPQYQEFAKTHMLGQVTKASIAALAVLAVATLALFFVQQESS